MASVWKGLALSAMAIVGWCAVAQAQDGATVVDNRQALMKAQGKDMTAVKAFIDDKGELAAAQAAGADLLTQQAKLPTMFPKGSGMAEFPGKSYARPAIWSESDKFAGAAKNAQAKAQVLEAALKGGDKAAITAAFGDLGKNGCGACHEPFREKKPS